MQTLMDGVIIDPLDQQVCELVAGVLQQHYPGHEWLVEADRRKGLIDIRNLDIHGGKGFRLHMTGHASASELADLTMRAGGEILERANVARGALTEDVAHDLAGRQRDRSGNVQVER